MGYFLSIFVFFRVILAFLRLALVSWLLFVPRDEYIIYNSFLRNVFQKKIIRYESQISSNEINRKRFTVTFYSSLFCRNRELASKILLGPSCKIAKINRYVFFLFSNKRILTEI